MTDDLRGMTVEEAEWADAIYSSVMEFDQERPRTKQTKNFQVGMSELGFCSERVRRMLGGITPELTDNLPAFIGTAVGDYIEQAMMMKWPEALRQEEVTTTLVGDYGKYNLMGHPDLVFPWGIFDVKTTRGLEVVRRTGPSRQQQYQRHGYCLGAFQAGLFGDTPLEELKVANVWFDRAADERLCHVQMEPYDQGIVDEAVRWLDEVIYNHLQGLDAPKEPPRNVCEAVCGHFSTCRALDTDVQGLIADETALVAVDLYREGLALESAGKKMKDQAKGNLLGVEGSTGEFLLRWTWVNESIVPESVRKAHQRMSLTKIKT